MTSADTKNMGIGLFLALLVAASWWAGFFLTPTDAAMGDVYRIIYLHVPTAFTAFLVAAVTFGFSIHCLAKNSERSLTRMKACAEVGLIFTVLALLTGSIWGRPTWGTWWTWDARLTTTLILGILYAAFLLVYASMESGQDRRRTGSVLGILIFADVPIVYQSVKWWRTLHQDPDLIPTGGSNMDPEMLRVLLFSIFAMLALSIWLILYRAGTLIIKHEVEEASLGNIS